MSIEIIDRYIAANVKAIDGSIDSAAWPTHVDSMQQYGRDIANSASMPYLAVSLLRDIETVVVTLDGTERDEALDELRHQLIHRAQVGQRARHRI